MPEKEIVSLEHVYVYFNQTPILEDLFFSIKEDAFIAVIGPNGGGKSTLLKVILGLVEPDSGTVKVFGKPPAEGRKYVGYLPQYKPLDLEFPISVYDTVMAGRYCGPFRKPAKEDHAAVKKALEEVGMWDYRDRRIGALSGGQMQRVFLARAIVREPRLLLLDEPTASLDPEMQKTFYSLLLKLKEKMAIVLVTHDIGVISSYVNEIACLNRRLFHHGPAEEGVGGLAESYRCPVDLIGHGAPHRVLRDHDQK